MEKQWKQWQTLFSWAPKSLQMVTAAMKLKDPCSLKKSYDHLGSVLKSRDITLPTKLYVVKAMDFPVVIYGCESWNIKKAECWRIDAFELWCWRRLLRVPWTAAYQAPLSMGFSRQEYWSGVPLNNLDSILKSRDITLPTNVCLVKAMAFPVVMYGCESWTIKKA